MMEEAKKEFLKFTESYKIYGEKIELKIKHTFRVQSLCMEIAKSIGLTEEEIIKLLDYALNKEEVIKDLVYVNEDIKQMIKK